MMAEHIVGPVTDFPSGSHRLVKVRNLEIGVFNVDGELYALPNICPHQFGPLCAGKTSGTMRSGADTEWKHEWVHEGEIITCPWHGIEFDITTGRALASPKLRVRQYPVSIEDGNVKIVL